MTLREVKNKKTMLLPPHKIFAIGDIHGCWKLLCKLLLSLPIDKKFDTLVFLGDYINRGGESSKVLDTLLDVKATYAHTVFLKGNHEQQLLEYAATGDPEILSLLRMMGVESTVTSYGVRVRQLRNLDGLPPAHRDFLQTLKFSFVAGKYLFTHADIDDEIIALALAGITFPAPQHHAEAGLLSSRRLSRESIACDAFTVVFGHSPFETPLVMADRICIDTGAVYGNVLTALELPAMRFHHA